MTPTIDEPFAWTWIDISGKRPAPPAEVAAAVQEWLLSDMPGDTVEEKQHRAWLATQLPAALRAKLGVK